ncbi:DNA cytosine methyltransferase, partial [Salmonella enterica subsp. enterica serovar Dublin]|nr:DNA cytosine methyltransferase [Salmonella enterica subsp. enterica serovar Heidelberg]EIY4999756.1 DNA cytosine methyltransferase [Salmonella enterica]ELG2786879.1 DNA cytosine methyltransferase [Salmonella enterica subsp. enterica serovar Dublin]ELG2791647.1 DNA cytosine methyltransferase [Salmonella enterica subsp. enterica serovar Dublin]ELG2805839.1 DNA cytosine methyltransferase [Salmonella enterica subsp. enterica serovar Dublin]
MLPIVSPSVVTKQLAFNRVGDKRKVRVSSNFLDVMGFKPGMGIAVEPGEGMGGFSVIPATDELQTHQVYQRRYQPKSRSNNPLETVIEFSGQGLIDKCFPRYTERFHVEMRKGRVVFTPVANRAFAIADRFRKTSPFRAFVALTGGVDIHVMESLGWKAEIVLEHRPVEARDRASGRNLSEVHALNTLVNSSPRILLNEDIHHLELDRLGALLAECPPIGLAHYSLGCDDHSNAKSPRDKERSLEDLSTMLDMVYPALKQIEVVNPAVVLVENVPNFKASGAGAMMGTTLRRMGYFLTEMVLNGLDFGAYQGRERYYMVASVFPGFVPPKPEQRAGGRLWPVIEKHLGDCADVTALKSIQARESTSRRMPAFLTRESTSCPTILKSQDRGVKDAVYIQDGGRIYKPSVDLVQELMSIPDSFDISWMAKEQATETLGQSVDYRLHSAVMAAVRDHLNVNCG